eukprot:scaffold212049_cov47-Prasinocladus_malaysianus.AAC.1
MIQQYVVRGGIASNLMINLKELKDACLNLSANDLSGPLPETWVGAGAPALRLILDGNDVCLPGALLDSAGASLYSGVFECPKSDGT